MSLIEELRSIWDKSTNIVKYSIVAGVLLTISALFFAGVFLFKQNYGVLFDDIEQHDAAAIVKELDRLKIPYKLENNGGRILVPEKDIHTTRLNIMGNEGIVSGSVGFEIFDKDDFGATEFAQKINYQRALQGELARTIMSNDKVKYARVHLVLPESSIFKESKSKPTASVSLILKKGMDLDHRQVAGIRNLVSSSVSGLKVKDITVVDQNGNVLSVQADDEFNMLGASLRLKKKIEVEKHLQSKAQQVLDETLGHSKAFVTVDVSLNLNTVKKIREEVVSPNSGQNISKKRETKSSTRTGKVDETSKKIVEVDYVMGKETNEIVQAPGIIERISVAIVVRDLLTDDEKNNILSVVGRSIGLQKKRGDLIAINVVSPYKAPDSAYASDNNAKISSETKSTKVFVFSNLKNRIAKHINSMLDNQPAVLAALLFLVIVLPLLLVTYFAKYISFKFSQNKEKLSDDERKKILNEIRQWLMRSEKLEG